MQTERESAVEISSTKLQNINKPNTRTQHDIQHNTIALTFYNIFHGITLLIKLERERG